MFALIARYGPRLKTFRVVKGDYSTMAVDHKIQKYNWPILNKKV